MQANGKLLEVLRLKNTVNGNPRYKVVILTDDGEYIRGNTASDAMYCYHVPSTNSHVSVKWHKTPKGRTVIDNLTAIE